MQLENLASFETIKEDLDFFDSWEDRYRYIIDLGKNLKPLDSQYKTDDHKVKGCTSQVWIIREEKTSLPDSLFFRADSDSTIVKGLVAILLSLVNGKPKAAIQNLSFEEIFQSLGLSGHLSPSRSNGFFAMVKHVQKIAQ